MKNPALIKAKYRASSKYRVVEWSDLSLREQETLSGLYDGNDVYGIFQPVVNSPHLTAKIAYREVALLYFHLQQSENIPHYFLEINEQQWKKTVQQLVLDNIIEIKYEGKFVSGTDALKAIFNDVLWDSEIVPGYLPALSTRAIQYGLSLHNLSVRSMSRRLYTFNTTPWDAVAKLNFYSPRSIKDFLFPESDMSLHFWLNKKWSSLNVSGTEYWLAWSKLNSDAEIKESMKTPIFKLYISSTFPDLPRVLRQSLPVLSAANTFSFKIGNSLEGLLRPDKMVAYFLNMEDLKTTAKLLFDNLKKISVQGVPFTSPLDHTGLLSFGVDPPTSEVLTEIEGASWRCKVTDQLSLAIIQAQEESLNMRESFDFIKAKLLLAGIDITNWTPTSFFKDELQFQ
jgi:hypothetical protein